MMAPAIDDVLKETKETKTVKFDLRTRFVEQKYRIEVEVPEFATERQIQRLKDRLHAVLIDGTMIDNWSHREIKELKVKGFWTGPQIYVIFEYGMIEDEDTMAAILCRTRYHWCIGPRGGLDAVNENGTWVDGQRALYATCRS